MPASQAVNSKTFTVTTPSDREIRMTRLFKAPRQLVFDALTKPEHVKRWWGNLDEQHSVPVCEIDLRVGGAWRFVNRFPGGEVTFYGVYREITPPDRLVYTEIFDQFPQEESVVTTVLTEEGGQTRLTATVVYSTRQVRDTVLGSDMERGAGLSYDRLEDLMAALQR